MAKANVAKRKAKEEASSRGTAAAIQELLKRPPALTPEEAEELERIIQAERARGLTDLSNPLTGGKR